MTEFLGGAYPRHIPIIAKDGRQFGYYYTHLPEPEALSRLSVNLIAFAPSLSRRLVDYPYPKEHSALVIEPGDLSIPFLQQLLPQLADNGVKFAVTEEGWETFPRELVPAVAYMIGNAASTAFDPAFRDLRQSVPTAKAVAYGLHDVGAFDAAREGPFNFYCGYFFTRPIHDPITPSVTHGSILQIMSLLENGSLEEIERAFLHAPQLSAELLTYLNSAGFAMREKISSMMHALMLIGRGGIREWLMRVMFDKQDKNRFSPALLRLAMLRGRLLSQLVERQGREMAERGFLVGMASLFGALFCASDDQVLAPMPLSGNVKEAILAFDGSLGEALKCLLAYEEGNRDRLELTLRHMGIDDERFRSAIAAAHAFSEQTKTD